MVLALFVLFIVTPIVEIMLLVRVGKLVGIVPTVAFVVGMGLLGATLARSQGRKVIRQWQEAASLGVVPEEGVLSGILVLFGALLMILPGVISDVFGLLLMVPFVRKPVAQALGAYLARKMASGQVQMYGVPGMRPSMRPRQATEVGRAVYRGGDVIDTEGEEIEPR